MKTIVLTFLIALSTAAWADDKRDQRNVYDVFREWVKPSAGATVDEQVTTRIKRFMANLLYPADMSSFARPDQDGKFRDLIIALQKPMGTPATGFLTSAQFDRLAEASRDIDDRPMILPLKKSVLMTNDAVLLAIGTGVMDGLAYPLNSMRIVCVKADSTCDVIDAGFDPKMRSLTLGDTPYEIKTWTPSRVTAIREHPCGTASMTIDVKAQAVTIATVPHADLVGCREDRPTIWMLVDGMPIARKLNEDRINRARALMYEPARKLIPASDNTAVP
jgi:hypothetical protein